MYTYRNRETILRNPTFAECRYLLTEKLHRAEFLDPIKNDITQFVEANIQDMLIKNEYQRNIEFVKPNKWFETLLVNINLRNKTTENGVKKDAINYFNESNIGENGKLVKPSINVNMLIDEKGKVNNLFIPIFIDHEITHLYDDWRWMSKGHDSLCNIPKTTNGVNMMEIGEYQKNKLLWIIGFGCYLSAYTEENSFISQTVSELRRINAKESNIKKKLRTTISFRNYHKFLIDIKYFIENCDNNQIGYTNFIIYNNFKKSGAPYIVPKKFDVNHYKEKIALWAQNIWVHFIKRYVGIVQYYLDDRRNDRLRRGWV